MYIYIHINRSIYYESIKMAPNILAVQCQIISSVTSLSISISVSPDLHKITATLIRLYKYAN